MTNIRAYIVRTTKKAAVPVAIGFALLTVLSVVPPQKADAAFSFQYSSPGSVSPGPAPLYSVHSILSLYELDGQFHFPLYTQVCEIAAQKIGLSDANTYTCVLSTYGSTGTLLFGNFPPNGDGLGGNGPCSGLSNCTTPPTISFYYSDLDIYAGNTVPTRSGCAVQDGPDPSGFSSITGSSCSIYKHAGVTQAAPEASLSAAPASITAGGASALTYSCTNSTSASIAGIGGVTGTSGTVSVSPGTTTTYTLTCTGSTQSATAQTTVTVTAVAAPDLTAGSVSPSSATAGTSVTLNATATNAGGAASGSFPMLFQVQETGALVNSAYIGGLSPAGSAPTTASYTFPSAGNYQVRACSNYNTGWATIVSESDYSNNCGPWTTVTVSAAVSPTPTCTFTANPTNSVPSTLTWSSTNATSCTGGGFNTGSATSGSQTVSVAGSYTLSCTGTGGTCPTQVVNVSAACTAPTLSLTGTPTRVKPGDTSVITYSATGVTSCSLTGPGAPAIAANTCTLPQGSFTTPALTTQTIYTLTCDGVTKNLIINVLPKILEF